MSDKMLIDASHKEETRVVVVRGNRIEEFDFESQHKKQLRGNIYLAKVTRVEPSLQAAFVDYGGNRHGFLAFSEIHPDYYQIPLADRQALLAAEAEAEAERARSENEEDEEEAAAAPSPIESGDEADGAEEEAKPQKAKGRSRRGRRKAETEAAAAGDDAVQPVDDEAEQSVEDTENATGTEEGGEESEGGDDDAAGPKTIAATVDVDEVSEEVGRRSDEDRDPGEVDLEAAQHVEGQIEAAPAVAADVEDTASSDDAEDEAGDDEDAGDEDDRDEDSDAADDAGSGRQNRRQPRGKRRGGNDERDDENGGKVESVGAEDALEELPDRSFVKKPRKQYRIQEVIKRRQIMLVQVVKEERGNKGAALTTYLSLAGRYSVLMPNTARGGGISRKITNVADRKRLKDVARGLEVPQGMGVILRTAGANRTKAEVKRDFEYLMRLWENVRNLTLASTAPCLVYEEGSLIKRSIRDLYNKDIGEVVVSGEEGYREAKDFMKMLMPSHAKVVQPYRDIHPIFSRSGIEAQLDRMLQPQVTLKSGGYIIINQTEALVAIDVNSGRSTKEHSIEDTALQTNLEAADEVARQLRLRDLAGLIVVDFIDMEEKRNNRSVEKRLKDALKNDRARIQVGRISHFGLLEMSRQRIRASVLESTTQVCEHCGGTGHVRSQSSVALHVLRSIEEFLLKSTTHNITVRTTPQTALYLLNQKRETIIEMERRFGVAITIEADATIGAAHLAIERGTAVETPVKIENIVALELAYADEEDEDDIVPTFDEEDEEEEAPAPARAAERSSPSRSETDEEGENGQRGKRRRRRRRRGGRDRDEDGAPRAALPADQAEALDEDDEDEGAEDAVTANGDESDATGERPRKRRRRGKRGGRRNRGEDDAQAVAGSEAGDADEASAAEMELEPGDEPLPEQSGGSADEAGDDTAEVAAAAASLQGNETAELLPDVSEEAVEEKPKKRRAAPRRKKAAEAEAETPPAEAPVAADAPTETVSEPAATAEAPEAEPEPAQDEPVEEPAPAPRPVVSSNGAEAAPEKPKKGGWWQRRGFF